MSIIPAVNARALIRAGKARCETLVYDDQRGRTYMAISTCSSQVTQHYLIGEGRIDADQLSSDDAEVYRDALNRYGEPCVAVRTMAEAELVMCEIFGS